MDSKSVIDPTLRVHLKVWVQYNVCRRWRTCYYVPFSSAIFIFYSRCQEGWCEPCLETTLTATRFMSLVRLDIQAWYALIVKLGASWYWSLIRFDTQTCFEYQTWPSVNINLRLLLSPNAHLTILPEDKREKGKIITGTSKDLDSCRPRLFIAGKTLGPLLPLEHM